MKGEGREIPRTTPPLEADASNPRGSLGQTSGYSTSKGSRGMLMPRAQIGVITENVHLAPGNHQAISEDSSPTAAVDAGARI